MRPGAKVGELPLPVKADDRILGKIPDQLRLIRLALPEHKINRLRPGQLKTLQRQLFLADPLHFLLKLLKDLRRENRLGIQVIIEAVLNGGTNCQLGIGIEALDRLGKNMAGGMPVSLLIFFIFKGEFIFVHIFSLSLLMYVVFRLDVKPYICHIAVLHDIFLAFGTQKALFFG